jgi:hypothetical protein
VLSAQARRVTPEKPNYLLSLSSLLISCKRHR